MLKSSERKWETVLPTNAGGMPDMCRRFVFCNSMFLKALPEVPDMPEVLRARVRVFLCSAYVALKKYSPREG